MRILYISLCISLILLIMPTTEAKIVFSAKQNGISNIYVMDDNGRNIKQLTDNTYWEGIARWTPNGRSIAFVRGAIPDQNIIRNIYMMTSDGAYVKHLTDRDAFIRDLRVSPNGKTLMYSTGGDGPNLVDIDTKESKKLLVGHVVNCDWSPDGKQIVYVNDDHGFIVQHLWMIDANGDNNRAWVKPDPERGIIDHYYPRWSPDGKQMLYIEMDMIPILKKDEQQRVVASGKRAAGTYRIVIHNINDDTIQTLKIPETWSMSSLAWMDDQRSVLFCARDNDTPNGQPIVSKIYKYDIATDELTFLTEGSSADWNAGELSVSPAGKQSVRWGELKKSHLGM
ncbi:hypothetical protein F4212_15250 [Candidatus Poribacteria bacterium]|nr:hypothetical protein [Candidatus Poribacteria bacterium]